MTLKHILYRTIRPFGGLQVSRYLARRHPRILMYHRIAERSETDIDVATFREQVDLITRHFNVLSMGELLARYDRGEQVENAVVITFDDGYQDFYRHAWPVLREFNVPASLFLTAGFVNGDLWLWPDQVRYCIDCAENAVTEIKLGTGSLKVHRGNDQSWHAVADYCLKLPDRAKHEFIWHLAESLRVTLPKEAPAAFKGLNWEQVREIAASGIEIGSHTVSHPIMTNLTQQDLRHELEESKALIERELGKPVAGFCYPNGQPGDFDRATKKSVSAAGYQYALAAYPSRDPLADRWAITRYSASRPAAAFEKQLFGMTFLRMGQLPKAAVY